MKTELMSVANLEVCERTRVRKQKPKAGGDVVLEYAEAYRCGLMVEPLDVFREKGTERFIIADGEHRLLALQSAKIEQVQVRLHEGDEVAALDFAIGCNHAHGVRRTKEDKYKALVRIMETPTLKDKYRTDTDLSEKIGISKRTVADYKAQWRNSESDDKTARRAKKRAQNGAEKKTRNDLKKPDKPDKPAPTPEQKKVAQQVRESVTPKANGNALPTAELHDFKRAVGSLAACKLDMAKVAANGVDWSIVESASDKLGKLLEHR